MHAYYSSKADGRKHIKSSLGSIDVHEQACTHGERFDGSKGRATSVRPGFPAGPINVRGKLFTVTLAAPCRNQTCIQGNLRLSIYTSIKAQRGHLCQTSERADEMALDNEHQFVPCCPFHLRSEHDPGLEGT